MSDSRSLRYLTNYSHHRVDTLSDLESRIQKESVAADFLVRVIRNYTSKTDLKVLDFGAGDFALTKALTSRGINTQGVDIDNLDFRSDKVSFPNNHFDAVLLMSIVEHLTDPTNVFEEAKRLLKQNGLLIVITPNWKYCYKSFYEDLTHIKPYTVNSLKFTVEMFGFLMLSVMPWSPRKSINFLLKSFAIKVCAHLPLRGDSRMPVPKIIKGKSSTLLVVAKKQ